MNNNNNTNKYVGNNCHICFPTIDNVSKKPIIVCADSVDTAKVVRKYMHPSDDVMTTLWHFNAKIKCFEYPSIFRKIEEYRLLKKFSNKEIQYNEIQYVKLDDVPLEYKPHNESN